MSVALLLVTHNNIATDLVDIASSIVHDAPENIACVEVPMDTSTEKMETDIRNKLEELDQRDGTLVLTDLYGGTPSNLANKFSHNKNTCFISGLNLPMLIKILNYRDLPLSELSEKTVDGGKQGIAIHDE